MKSKRIKSWLPTRLDPFISSLLLPNSTHSEVTFGQIACRQSREFQTNNVTEVDLYCKSCEVDKVPVDIFF